MKGLFSSKTPPESCHLTRHIVAQLPGIDLVSFKLETEESILDKKVLSHFQANSSAFVVSNLLQSRNDWVIVNRLAPDGATLLKTIVTPADGSSLEDNLVGALIFVSK
jgi:hypothetical protein